MAVAPSILAPSFGETSTISPGTFTTITNLIFVASSINSPISSVVRAAFFSGSSSAASSFGFPAEASFAFSSAAHSALSSCSFNSLLSAAFASPPVADEPRFPVAKV